MNSKGIFFTFIVFLLALAVIFSSSGIKQTKALQKENIINETAFSSVNSRFENIYNEIFTIKTGYPGRQQSRILPFNYDAGNTIIETSAQCNWLFGWSNRKKITIQNSFVDSDLENFPLYVKISNDSDIGASARTDGYDIRFTQSNGTTTLSYERESFSINGGQATANFWVKIPTISASSGATIYLYYGNASATDGTDPANVWDSNFKGVWHLPNGTTLTANDSTVNANNGTISGATAGAGKVGGGANFVASSSQEISVAYSSVFDANTYTIGAWTNITTTGSTRGIVGTRFGGENTFDCKWSTTSIHGDIGSGSSWLTTSADYAYTPSTGTWYNVIYVVTTGGTWNIYFNGSLVANGSFLGTPQLMKSGETLHIGNSYSSGEYFDGIIDEVRVSNAARSADWIKFEYSNIAETDNELSWGTQEIAPSQSDCTATESGWIQIEQHLPQDNIVFSEAYDALNLYRVFVEYAQNNLYTETTVTNVAKNTEWGGTSSDVLHYLVLPQCVKYSVVQGIVGDSYVVAFEKGQTTDGCNQNFDINSIKKIEITITIPQEDVVKDTPRCNGELKSGSNCKTDAYAGAQLGKYYASIRIIAPNCDPQCGGSIKVCCIANSDQTVSAYVDNAGTAENSIELKDDAGWGNAGKFYVMDAASTLISKIENKHNQTFNVKTKITFANKIDEVKFNGFGFEVSKQGFDNLKRGS